MPEDVVRLPQSGFRAWLVATRPWSFTASVIPVTVGAALAWVHGFAAPWLFLLTVLGGVLVQAGTNLFNTYGDFLSGVDTPESSLTCPQLTSGAMAPAAMRRAAFACFGLALVPGLVLVHTGGWPVLAFGVFGLVGGYAYTLGPCPLKYAGAGTLAVALLMGPCMTAPAWLLQGAPGVALPMLAALPVACLVVAILHANDLRDMEYDAASNIRTLSLWLGRRNAARVYAALVLGAYMSLGALALTQVVPLSALTACLTLPLALRLVRIAQTTDADPRIEGETARLHALFGLLYAGGIAARLMWS